MASVNSLEEEVRRCAHTHTHTPLEAEYIIVLKIFRLPIFIVVKYYNILFHCKFIVALYSYLSTSDVYLNINIYIVIPVSMKELLFYIRIISQFVAPDPPLLLSSNAAVGLKSPEGSLGTTTTV